MKYVIFWRHNDRVLSGLKSFHQEPTVHYISHTFMSTSETAKPQSAPAPAIKILALNVHWWLPKVHVMFFVSCAIQLFR